MNPHLAQGYSRCAQITKEHGTTYYWGAQLLPRERRRHVHAVYALARLADDIVDLPGSEVAAPDAAAAYGLDDFEEQVWRSLREGGSSDPVLAAIAASVTETGMPHEQISRFFRAMRSDLTQTTYETWPDLLDYMDGSAAVIGEMMLPVLGPTAEADAPARALGQAFQLTNFLRDVAEDLDRGRVYLPQEDLRRYAADPHRRSVDPSWRELMAFQIERNRRLYREADHGIPLLRGGAQRCVATARVLYARILDLIEDADYDVFSGRLAVPTATKARTAARMVSTRDPLRLVRADRAAARPMRGGWVDQDPVQLVTDDGGANGTAAKSEIHHDDTPLHLAFSCYVFDTAGRLLVTRRAAHKMVFPGERTNTVCGHPLPGESLPEAIARRGRSELGLPLEAHSLRLHLPRFRYRAASGSIWEHELCPVYSAVVAEGVRVTPDPREVDEAMWVPWGDVVAEATRPGVLSPWAEEQIPQLVALGSDPQAWPTADPGLLPPAARVNKPDPGGAA